MKLYDELLMDLKGVINTDTLRTKYYKTLPPELAKWYVYTLEHGHCVFTLLKQFEPELQNIDDYLEYIMTIPVKTVLRGYTVNPDGVIVVEGLDYNDELGLRLPAEFFEYFTEETKEIKEMNLISVETSKGEVVKTNFFQSSYNQHGLFYLSYCDKCFQLFIPSKYLSEIKEFNTGKYVVITTGFHNEIGREMVELLFEDYSSTPYSLHLSLTQLTYRLGSDFNGLKFKLNGYCETGKVIEMDAYVRSDKTYPLPFLNSIKTGLYSEA